MEAEQTSTAKTTASDREAASDHSEMAVYVGLPLIIAAFLAIIALLLLLVYFVLRAKNKRLYAKVHNGAEPPLKNLSSLPYPYPPPAPAIKLGSADMTFTVAPQPSPASTQRYPFRKHKRQQSKTIHAQEKRQKSRKNAHTSATESARSRRDSGTHSVSPPEDSAGNGSVISLNQFGEQHDISKKQVGRSTDKLPEIFLALTYLREKTTLLVNVEKVIGLPPRDDGAEVDAYVRLFFIPRLPEMAQRKTSKTRTAKKELDPVFHEQIQYEAMSEEELINSTLHVQVLDYRAYGRHLIIGQSELSMGQVTLGEDQESVVLQLHPPRVSEVIGVLIRGVLPFLWRILLRLYGMQ